MKLKNDPYFQSLRDDLAKIYRDIRKDNPKMARLLFEREKACLNALIDLVNKELTFADFNTDLAKAQYEATLLNPTWITK